MKILCLVPPDPKGLRLSKYSFLDEEMRQVRLAGNKVHLVSPYVDSGREIAGSTLHPVPRVRSLLNTTTSILKFWNCTRGIADRLQAARILLTIENVIRRESIDVVYCAFLWPSGLGGLPAAFDLRVPVVLTLRGADVLIEESLRYGQTLDPRFRALASSTLIRASRIIAVSTAIAVRAIELGAQPCRTNVILKGVSCEHFSPGSCQAARQKLGLRDLPTVLFVGNLLRIKGVDLLIRACVELSQDRDFQLVICGDGPEEGTLRNLARKLEVSCHVHFVGRISRKLMPVYFQACNIHVLPSRTEGSGNVLLEAYASAKPVIGTNCSGIIDYIDDGKTGFLFEKNNASDLASKLGILLDFPELAERFGRAGLQRVKEKHQYEHMIKQILNVFQEAIESHK